MILQFYPRIFLCCLLITAAGKIGLKGQSEVNYDEANVPDFSLPDPRINSQKNKVISNIKDWEEIQRPYLLNMFADRMYGIFPDENLEVSFILESSQSVFEDKGVRKEVTINVRSQYGDKDISLLIYLPNQKDPAPVFLGLNFYGNHTIHPDPAITIHRSWVPNNQDFEITNNRVSEKNRGVRQNRWPVEYLLDQGYGLATMYYGEIDPDFDDDFENGVHSLLGPEIDKSELSSLSAWAWALSQACNYLESDSDVDRHKISVIGHSRLGKAALWAGARDERFAMVISNDSGCGGAALSRRRFGETVGRINLAFPHWFNEAFNDYNNREEELPFDQHTLLSLIAPRLLYVASAEEDQWADPRGEFLSARYASEIYDLYKMPSLSNLEMPEINQPISDKQVGYHIRSGGHDINQYDWEQFVHFANNHFKKG